MPCWALVSGDGDRGGGDDESKVPPSLAPASGPSPLLGLPASWLSMALTALAWPRLTASPPIRVSGLRQTMNRLDPRPRPRLGFRLCCRTTEHLSTAPSPSPSPSFTNGNPTACSPGYLHSSNRQPSATRASVKQRDWLTMNAAPGPATIRPPLPPSRMPPPNYNKPGGPSNSACSSSSSSSSAKPATSASTSASTMPVRPSPLAPLKREPTDDGKTTDDDDEVDDEGAGSNNGAGSDDGKQGTKKKMPKKKKANRACAACQKAHLTCDDGKQAR